MSWDVRFVDPVSKETVYLSESHHLAGGTLAVGGTREAWLNITYNYGGLFRKHLHTDGLAGLSGKTPDQMIPLLDKAIDVLGTYTSDNYWDPTPGNAGAALTALRQLARLVRLDHPTAILEGC